MTDKGFLIFGKLKGTTEATDEAPEQYARISCITRDRVLKPLRVVMSLKGFWIGPKLQFSAWFNGRLKSYDQWDFGGTGLGVIPGPLGLITPSNSSYHLIDVSADLLLGSFTPLGTGIFARENSKGVNS